jgi:hypothetical protein
LSRFAGVKLNPERSEGEAGSPQAKS